MRWRMIGEVDRRMWRWIGGQIEAEQDRWFLWTPVLFGIGIAVYVQVAVEPPLVLAASLSLAALLLVVMARNHGLGWAIAGLLFVAIAGFAAAKMRADATAAYVLERPTRPVLVTGWIELVEPRPARGQRLTVRVATMEGRGADTTPKRVRVRTLGLASDLKPGDAIAVRATLSPPASPPLPGGYDFARSAWFQSLGGVGYAREAAKPIALEMPQPIDLKVRAGIERVRQAIGQRIMSHLPNETGAIANALITGERGAISDATNSAYRDSGLFHILSISGLHMVIMAGAVFFTVRLLLSLSPTLALRYPIKTWAAIAAALGALGYLLISGSSFPTVRSYLMISIMFLAIVLDRPAVALRNVALSAMLILVMYPESLIDVGFQMSYAAVVALVSVYEWIREREAQRAGQGVERGPVLQLVLFFGGIVLSTLIASVAVAPFAAFHFHTAQKYAVIANLIAIPICNILVMPAALAVLVAMPFGLEAWPLHVMGVGISAMTWCAYTVAALPGAVMRMPEIPVLSFALIVSGGLWLCLWARSWRFAGLVPILIGLALAPFRDPPDVLIARDGRLVAVRGADGRLSAIGEASGAFDLSRWLEHDGDERSPKVVARGDGFLCDAVGCAARVKARTVSVARHPAALADDCQRAAVVIATFPRALRCAQGVVVLDAQTLRAAGATSLTFAPSGLSLRTVAAERGVRPWSPAGGSRSDNTWDSIWNDTPRSPSPVDTQRRPGDPGALGDRTPGRAPDAPPDQGAQPGARIEPLDPDDQR